VFLAAIKGLQDLTCLERIPQSMPWRAFRLPTSDLVLLEWIRRPNRNNPPPLNMIRFPDSPEFACRPAGVSLPDRFGVTAPGLDDLYDRLLRDKRAGTLSKVAVQSAIMLSEISGGNVLSIASDDEEWDLACEAKSGALAVLRFDAGHEDILISGEGVINSSPTPDQKLLHRIAQSAATNWCDDLKPIFGFDSDINKVPLSEAARVNFRPELPVLPSQRSRRPPIPWPPQKSRPFWKFW
jgi:hypothetical protein